MLLLPKKVTIDKQASLMRSEVSTKKYKMNIILFLNKDLEANLTYNLLKEELLKHRVKIYYSESVGKQNTKPKDLLAVEYYEKEYIYKELVPAIKQAQIATSFEFFDVDFKTFEIAKCTNPNKSEFIEAVRAFEPDLFISIRFAKIFREEIIKVPKKGILNLHSAILPDYRGIFGTLHNLKDNKALYGCTLHYISSRGIDTGEIISIVRKPIDKKKSLLWHVLTLYPLGARLILESIQKLATFDRLPCLLQDNSAGSYFSVPTAAHFEQLKALGFTIFDAVDYQELLEQFISSDVGRILNPLTLPD